MSINGDHADLVDRAVRWLRNTQRCWFVLREFGPITVYEIPDAIGWTNQASHLVECKATRSDFLADAKKPFRRHPEMGMGQYRWYMTYPTLISADELPRQWGLLWVYPHQVRVIRGAWPFDAAATALAERPALCAALRRVEARGDLEKIYTLEGCVPA